MDKTISNLNSDQLSVFRQIFGDEPIRPSLFKGIECNYLRVYGFRYWDSDESNRFIEMKTRFNRSVQGVRMEIIHHSDYEVEFDGDRSYPASFTFTIEKI